MPGSAGVPHQLFKLVTVGAIYRFDLYENADRAARLSLFLNDGFHQISRLVYINTAQDGGEIRKQLQRNDLENA